MQEKNKEIAERFSLLIDSMGGNASKFAKVLGVSPQNIYDIKSGKTALSSRIIEKILTKYSPININWLLSGDGEMFIDFKEYESSGPDLAQINPNVLLEEKIKQISILEGQVEEQRKTIYFLSELIKNILPHLKLILPESEIKKIKDDIKPLK